jgi:hypothetical protein
MNELFKSCDLCLDNKPMEVVDSFLNLGHISTSDLKDDADIINLRIATAFLRTFVVNGDGGRQNRKYSYLSS